METRLFSITGEIRPRKSAKRGKTWDRASFLRQSKAEGARAETDVFGNVETEASKGIIANGIRGNGLYGNKKRKEAGLGAIKADVVENLEIGNMPHNKHSCKSSEDEERMVMVMIVVAKMLMMIC